MLRLRLHTRVLGTLLTMVAAVSAVGAFLAVNQFTHLLFDGFHDRSIAYVQAFASSIAPWLDPIDEDMLRATSRLMMAGSALFIRLELDGQLLLDERPEELRELALETGDSPAAATASAGRLPDGSVYLDVIAPISTGPGGTIRIGIDQTAVVLQARHTTLLAAGAAVLFDLLLMGTILWGVLRTKASEGEAAPTGRATRVTVGRLTVDIDAKTTTLDGRPVALTPKQFTLLRFLAERADRVCSDEEILEGVWPDSSYADSKDVKQYVYLLRRRLAAIDPREKARIATVPGFGYKLVSALVDREMTDD